VSINGVLIESIDHIVQPGEAVLQVGKRRFVRLIPLGTDV
jgi:hypothetical protein